MACGPCARRRKALEAKRKAKAAAGKPVQAAALGMVLAATEAAGKVMGIHGEVEDGQEDAASGQESGTAGEAEAKPVAEPSDDGAGQGTSPDR